MPTLISFTPNTKAESAQVNSNFSAINGILRPTFEIPINGTLTVGIDLTPYIIVPQNMTIIKAYARVKTSPTGAAILIDINKNGTTIWSTQSNRLTIADAGLSATQTSFNITSLSEGDYLSFDVDQVGSTTPGQDLTIALKCSV